MRRIRLGKRGASLLVKHPQIIAMEAAKKKPS
jgi:hypothetical protein